MKITPTIAVSQSSLPATTKRVTAEPKSPSAWTPKTTPTERRLLERAVDDAINLPDGASFRVRIGQVKSVSSTVGAEGARIIEGQLSNRIPARNAEERARILSAATALGVKTPALTQRILGDAVAAGDAQLALELVNDGATLSKGDRAKLAPHILGDEVLSSPDATRNLSRAAISVLSDNPAALERFAKSLTRPEILFTEVIANKDRALGKALEPLVDLLSPKTAAAVVRNRRAPEGLTDALRTRAAQK